MKRQLIVIAGYYGFGNAGDELILRAMVERFRLQDPASPLVVLSADPAKTAAAFNVMAVNRWNPFAWMGVMFKAKLFVLGGGGLLQEATGSLNHLYYLSLVIAAKFLGAKTETVGLGIDPVRGVFNRWLTGRVFNYWLDRIQVRDKASMRVLRAAGVDRTIDVQPDLVTDLPIVSSKSDASRIAFALAPWRGRTGWDQDLALFCQELIQKLNAPIDLIPFFPEQDTPLAEKVIAQVRGELGLRVWGKPEDLLSWIPEYGMVIGMRFHALVLAAKAEVAYIGWGNQCKVRQFCVDNTQPFWDFDRGWNLESVLRQAVDVWGRRATAAKQRPTGATVLVQTPKPSTTNLLYSTRPR